MTSFPLTLAAFPKKTFNLHFSPIRAYLGFKAGDDSIALLLLSARLYKRSSYSHQEWPACSSQPQYALSPLLSTTAHIPFTASAVALEGASEDDSHTRFFCSSDCQSKELRLSLTLGAKPLVLFMDVLQSVVLGCVTLRDTGVLPEASSAEGLW